MSKPISDPLCVVVAGFNITTLIRSLGGVPALSTSQLGRISYHELDDRLRTDVQAFRARRLLLFRNCPWTKGGVK